MCPEFPFQCIRYLTENLDRYLDFYLLLSFSSLVSSSTISIYFLEEVGKNIAMPNLISQSQIWIKTTYACNTQRHDALKIFFKWSHLQYMRYRYCIYYYHINYNILIYFCNPSSHPRDIYSPACHSLIRSSHIKLVCLFISTWVLHRLLPKRIVELDSIKGKDLNKTWTRGILKHVNIR